jgi:hypothetical protein
MPFTNVRLLMMVMIDIGLHKRRGECLRGVGHLLPFQTRGALGSPDVFVVFAKQKKALSNLYCCTCCDGRSFVAMPRAIRLHYVCQYEEVSAIVVSRERFWNIVLRPSCAHSSVPNGTAVIRFRENESRQIKSDADADQRP